MALRELALRIKPEWQGAQAQKGIQTQSKLLREQKKDITELGKSQSKVLKDAGNDLKKVNAEAEKFHFTFKNAFRGAKGELDQFGRGVDALKTKLVSLKSIVVGSAIGGLVLAGIDKLLKGGQAEQRATGRINREFGSDSAFLRGRANALAKAAGISREDALKAIIPIAEATQETQAGTNFRGRKLNATQATSVRRQTTGFGTGLLSRIATVTGASGDELSELSQALAEAGSGPEGVRRFAATIGGNRVFAREFNAANQKNQAFQFLSQRGFSADRLKSLGIAKGKTAGQGTVLDVIAQQAGITDEAAAAKRHSFGFQRQAITASIDSTLGEVGAAALDKLTKSFGKGKTLAEKFQEALESDKGKKVIDGIANGIDSVVKGVIKIATELPKIFRFVEDHKTAFTILGGGIVAAKGISMGAGLFKGAKSVLGAFGVGGGGLGKELAGALGAKPIPVYVVNAPTSVPGLGGGGLSGAKGIFGKVGALAGAGGVASGLMLAAAGAAAAYGGYKAGDYLGKKFKPIGQAHNAQANALYSLTGEAAADKKLEDFEVMRNRKQLVAKANKNSAFVKQLEAAGLNHGQAVYVAEHGTTSAGFAIPKGAAGITVNMGDIHTGIGQTPAQIAHALVPHIEEAIGRRMQTRTANGGAPSTRMP